MSERALVVAIGNPWRGDDGVAARTLALLAAEGVETLSVHGLVPEHAEDLVGCDRVVFVDADVACAHVVLEPVGDGDGAGHVWSPGAVVALARTLGFAGDAWVCRIPAEAFADGEGLSVRAEAGAALAARRLREWLSTPDLP